MATRWLSFVFCFKKFVSPLLLYYMPETPVFIYKAPLAANLELGYLCVAAINRVHTE